MPGRRAADPGGRGGRDSGRYSSLVGEHAAEQELAGERDALDGIAEVSDRGECVGGAGPRAGERRVHQ